MLEPLLFRVLVRVIKLEEHDDTYKRAKAMNLQIVEGDGRKRDEGSVDRATVVAVGPVAFKEWGDSPVVEVGDEVFFAKYAGKHLKDPYTGEEFLALNDEDLVARISE